MTTMTISNAREQRAQATQGYLRNVGQAAASLLAALLAVQPRTAQAQAKVQAREKKRDLARLYHMARQYDSVSPSLSAELRYMAARAND